MLAFLLRGLSGLSVTSLLFTQKLGFVSFGSHDCVSTPLYGDLNGDSKMPTVRRFLRSPVFVTSFLLSTLEPGCHLHRRAGLQRLCAPSARLNNAHLISVSNLRRLISDGRAGVKRYRIRYLDVLRAEACVLRKEFHS